ncbi:MAG: glycosyltransferase family 4 protein [Balneolaceae bacterium]|nr:MAG: glycosyltransferase family 4 protein [Balneolaceae bacterium]
MHPPKNALTKNIGGMQRVSMQLAEELEKVDDVNLLQLTNETSWRFIGLKSFWFLFKTFLTLPRLIRKHNIDIVLFSSMVTGSLAWFIRMRVNIPMVSITHGHDVTFSPAIYQWLVKRVFGALDGVISVSSATKEQCLIRGLSPDKGVVLPNGFVPGQIENEYDKSESRQYLNEHFNLRLNGEHLLLTVGRLIKRKGHSWFISEVLPKIKSPVVYMIIGDGPEATSIQSVINQSTSGRRILNVGRQPDEVLKRAYSAASLFVMPNIQVQGDMEGFGVVLLEANVANTPAVASDLEGIRDVIKPGVNGYRIPAMDSDAFAGKIDEILENELGALSESCRKYVYDTFRWDVVAQRYVEYLQDVITRNRN